MLWIEHDFFMYCIHPKGINLVGFAASILFIFVSKLQGTTFALMILRNIYIENNSLMIHCMF